MSPEWHISARRLYLPPDQSFEYYSYSDDRHSQDRPHDCPAGYKGFDNKVSEDRLAKDNIYHYGVSFDCCYANDIARQVFSVRENSLPSSL